MKNEHRGIAEVPNRDHGSPVKVASHNSAAFSVGCTRISYRFIPGNIPVLRNLFWIKEDLGRWGGDYGRLKERHLFWNVWYLNWKLWQSHIESITGTFERFEPICKT